MSEQDPAALVAEVRFYSVKARRVMEEINADPPQYVDYLDRLASALSRAQADAARMREALEPFAKAAGRLSVDAEPMLVIADLYEGVYILARDLQAARAALEPRK